MASKSDIKEAIKRLANWHNGKVPIDVLADTLKVSEEEAKDLLNEFSVDVRKPVVKRPPKQVKHAKTANAVHNVAKHILPWGALIIAIIALGRSILFTFNYFDRTDSFYSAIFMAILFGLVGYLAPSITLLAFQTRRWFIFIGALIAFGLFSWINIYVTVQELNITKLEKESTVITNQGEIIENRDKVARLESEIKRNEDNVVLDKKEYQILLEKSANPELETWEYNRHRTNMETVNKRITQKENDIIKSKEEIKVLTSIDGYYTMEAITKEEREQARSMDIVFAVSLEVIGPLFTAIALFL